MTDQDQIARICHAMRIEPTDCCGDYPGAKGSGLCGADVMCEYHKCTTGLKDTCPIRMAKYPTGPALVEALKEKIWHKGEWKLHAGRGYYKYLARVKKGTDGLWYSSAADTELDALLAACEQAFCGEGES